MTVPPGNVTRAYLIITFGKAMRSGSLMSLLRIYPSSSISGCLSFSEEWHLISVPFSPPPPGLFPGGPQSSPPLLTFCIPVFPPNPLPTPNLPTQPLFRPHNSFHSPMVEVEGRREGALPQRAAPSAPEAASGQMS